MALTFIKYSESVNYKSIRIHTVDKNAAIGFLNWCRDKELYLYWFNDDYVGVRNMNTIISSISKGSYVSSYITICYLDDLHPDVVELKLSWL